MHSRLLEENSGALSDLSLSAVGVLYGGRAQTQAALQNA
jgi:hypothetical protein